MGKKSKVHRTPQKSEGDSVSPSDRFEIFLSKKNLTLREKKNAEGAEESGSTKRRRTN